MTRARKPKQDKMSVPMREPSRKVKFKPLNQYQVNAMAAISENDLSFLIGPAGSAKTHLAVTYAIQELLDEKYKFIYIARPVVETAGESLGFLPGTFEQKLDPYLTPIYDCLDIIFDESQKVIREEVMKRIRIAPIAFCRGRTFSKSICILDEAQNATLNQLKAWTTRLGLESKMIITGDPTQNDIPWGASKLVEVAKAMSKIKGVAVVELPKAAIVRHRLVAEMVDVYEKMEAKKK